MLYIIVGICLGLAAGFFAVRWFIKQRFLKTARADPSNKKSDEQNIKKRPVREIELWQKPLQLGELNKIRKYIVDELVNIKGTNWGNFALQAMCTQAPAFRQLIVNNEVNLGAIRREEERGINDAVKSTQLILPSHKMKLRDFFHKVFKEVYTCSESFKDNRFYIYGRNRVIAKLRTFRASSGSFVESDARFYDAGGEEFELDTTVDAKILRKVKKALDFYEEHGGKVGYTDQIKEHYRFEIKSKHPVIEFDLDAITHTGNYIHAGSLVNCLFIELQKLLRLATDYSYLEPRYESNPLYDYEAVSFSYEEGIVFLVRYKGVVDYFPDRLYVELHNISPQSWLARWLKIYKLHIEGND